MNKKGSINNNGFDCMKKVSIFLSTKTIDPRLDLSCIEKSNPGMGATPYLFFSLAYILRKNSVKFDFFVDSPIELPKLKTIFVENVYKAIEIHKEKDNDVMIMRSSDDERLHYALKTLNVDVIFWSHNRVYSKLANLISENDNVKLHVCVSEHQAFSLINHKVANKNTVILNPCIGEVSCSSSTKENAVVFMGTLDKNRGLHVLAKAWPIVVEKMPNALLYVIGGNIYNTNNKDTTYINRVNKLFGNSIKNVKYLGVLGSEKNHFFSKSKVAVLNPYGYEAMPVTGIEFLAMGLPVVTMKRFGQKEIVKDEYNGFFCSNYKDLASKILFLLENEKQKVNMSKNSIQVVKKKFNKKKFEDLWMAVLADEVTIYNNPDKFSMEYSVEEKIEGMVYNIRKYFKFIPSYYFLLNVGRNLYLNLKSIRKINGRKK